MKKCKNLSIVLYGFAILSLVYTCYILFNSYSSFTSYYATSNYEFSALFQYVAASGFQPLMTTVILYALARFAEIVMELFPHPAVETIQEIEETNIVENQEETQA